LDRKPGGAYLPETNESSYYIEVYPYQVSHFELNAKGFEVDIYLDIKLQKNFLSNYKTKAGLHYVMAALSAKEKELDESLVKQGTNSFSFTTPKTNTLLTFKLLTHGDEKKIESEIKGLQKVNPNGSYDITTRLKYMITSINGDSEKKSIREFVDTYLLAPDARALREYYNKIQPDIEMKFMPEDESYTGEGIAIPISLNFFWPDSGV
jgi:hypothetical protein